MEVIGHRGYPAIYPENTLGGFQRALAAGCSGLEMDLQLTKDNKVVIIHDQRLERTTTGQGYLRDHTLAQLKKLDAGNQEKIPTLEEVLEKFTKTKLLLEIKVSRQDSSERVKKLLQQSIKLVKEKNAPDKIYFVSGSKDALQRIKQIQPDTSTGLIFSRPWRLTAYPHQLARLINILCPRIDRLEPNVVAWAQRQQMPLYPWPVDTKDDVKMALRYGAHGIVSNCPGKVRKYI